MTGASETGGRADDRDGFRFRGGSNALDLTATLAGRRKEQARELLATPEDLARWLVAAGLAPSPPETTVEDLNLARRLREAVYALATARQSGGADDPGARAVLNGIAAGAPATPQLSPDGRLELKGPAGALLATLAREAVALLGGDGADRVRQCESPTCTIFFVDTSRSGDRRWCSMSGCGNKAKVAEFRRRRRAQAGP